MDGSLPDPGSVLNTTTGTGYSAMNRVFNVDASGNVTAGTLVAQTSDQTKAIIAAYANSVSGDTVSQNTAAAETTYVGDAIANVTNVKQLVSGPLRRRQPRHHGDEHHCDAVRLSSDSCSRKRPGTAAHLVLDRVRPPGCSR